MDSLKESLNGYETQLEQINSTLRVTPKGEEYDALVSLRTDMMLLIDMTRESLHVMTSGKKETSGNGDTKRDDTLDDEYALFMAEMAGSGAFEKGDSLQHKRPDNVSPNDEQSNGINNESGTTNGDVDIEEEISSLQGMKCSVLYSHRWGGAASLHNAMVCSVERDTIDHDYNNIQVKVLFTNPTHVEMVPCPYYLDGDCKFGEEQCRYSHGEVVSLSSLSEATEPNFSLLKSGCRVLAKINQPDEPSNSRPQDNYLIWHRAVVREVDKATLNCTVKLEHSSVSSKDTHDVAFTNLFPLTGDTSDDTDTESSESDTERPSTSFPSNEADKIRGIQSSLRQDHGSVRLGEWEKHTKGFGSKLMMSMGWVSGSGLGVRAEGRLHPVQCQITPLGKSLDHCMNIKEGIDTGKITKRLKRLQKRKEEREKKAYERLKDREIHDVFNVLNSVLSVESNQHNPLLHSFKGKSTPLTAVKNKSSKNLNIEHFQLSEDASRINRDIEKLKSSLARNEGNSLVCKSIRIQLNDKYRELATVRSKQNSVTSEQADRKHNTKMTVF